MPAKRFTVLQGCSCTRSAAPVDFGDQKTGSFWVSTCIVNGSWSVCLCGAPVDIAEDTEYFVSKTVVGTMSRSHELLNDLKTL